MMSKERRIPKNAVKPLIEHCAKLSREAGRPAAEIFKEYLELMNKYADFFFSEPWPEKTGKQFLWLNDADAGLTLRVLMWTLSFMGTGSAGTARFLTL